MTTPFKLNATHTYLPMSVISKSGTNSRVEFTPATLLGMGASILSHLMSGNGSEVQHLSIKYSPSGLVLCSVGGTVMAGLS